MEKTKSIEDRRILLSNWLKLKRKTVMTFHPWKPFFFVLELIKRDLDPPFLSLSYYRSSGVSKEIIKSMPSSTSNMEILKFTPIKSSSEKYVFVLTFVGKQYIKVAAGAKEIYKTWRRTISTHLNPAKPPKSICSFNSSQYSNEDNSILGSPLPLQRQPDPPYRLPKRQSSIASNDTIELDKEFNDIYLFVPTTGTTVGIPDQILTLAQEKVDSMVDENNIIPERGDLDDSNIHWHHGKPNYSLANLAYFEGKTKNHPKGSLELIVENLVKTWEMEASHKSDFSQWTTVQHDVYHAKSNNGRTFYGDECLERGNYNILLDDCNVDLYDAANETFSSSHHHFRTAFPNGFPWELLEVYCGPPDVAFSWRHWANFDGEYKGNKGKGEVVEMTGFCVATVNSELKIQSLHIFYRPEPFLEMLEGIRPIPLPQKQKVRTLFKVDKSHDMNFADVEQKCPFISDAKSADVGDLKPSKCTFSGYSNVNESANASSGGSDTSLNESDQNGTNVENFCYMVAVNDNETLSKEGSILSQPSKGICIINSFCGAEEDNIKANENCPIDQGVNEGESEILKGGGSKFRNCPNME